MIDLNTLLTNALAAAVADALAPLSARLDALERHAPATSGDLAAFVETLGRIDAASTPATIAESPAPVRALAEQVAANHVEVSNVVRDAFEAIARLDARISGLSDTLSDRITALETATPMTANPSAWFDAIANTLRGDLDAFRKSKQVTPPTALFEAIRAIADNSADEALDAHANTYDHNDFLTEIDEDDLGDKVQEYIDNNIDIDEKVKEAMDGLDLDDKIRDYIRSNVSVDLNCN